jgi:hypothetical protein
MKTNPTTLKNAFLSLLIILPITTSAFAGGDEDGSDKPLVTILGNLSSKYSTEMKPEDLERIRNEIQDLESLTPITISKDDLMRDGDERAMKDAAIAISRVLIESSKNLVDLKIIIYRYFAQKDLPEFRMLRDSLYSNYQNKFNSEYKLFLTRLMYGSDEIMDALVKCKSELCVATISGAQYDLIKLGTEINRDLVINGTENSTPSYQLTSKLLKRVIGETSQLLSANDSAGAQTILVKQAFTALAAESSQLNIGHFMNSNGKARNYESFLTGKMIAIQNPNLLYYGLEYITESQFAWVITGRPSRSLTDKELLTLISSGSMYHPKRYFVTVGKSTKKTYRFTLSIKQSDGSLSPLSRSDCMALGFDALSNKACATDSLDLVRKALVF